jgi:drug/metabolite transporter (DMT)-like permease
MNQRQLSVLLALVTIVCWGSLATLGKLINYLPPFFVIGTAFLIGALPGLYRPREVFPAIRTQLWGTFGFYFYHFFLFYALRHAPAVEANLINYMWPVLMVLMTPLFFPGQGLRTHHLIGTAFSVLGCVLLISGQGLELSSEHLYGYLLAAGAALTWPIYSLGKKKMPAGSVWSISGACLGAGILSLITHALIEPRVVLQLKDVGIILALGLGPFGLAFYLWDLALQKGEPRLIGALAYLTPVFSTLGLVLFAGQTLSPSTSMAMVLIIGGASAGLLDLLPPKLLKITKKF